MSKEAKLFLERVMNGQDDSSVNLEQRIRAAEVLLKYDTETDVKKDARTLYPRIKGADNNKCNDYSVIEASGKSFHKGSIVQVASGSWKYPKRTGEVIRSLDLDYRNSHHLVKLHNENVKYFVFPTYLLKTWIPRNRL